jgi:hypothetical protein
LRDAYAASAKQSILKNLGAVKSFLSQCEILQPERLLTLAKVGRHTIGIPALSGRFDRPLPRVG